jgi:hypothetical protein
VLRFSRGGSLIAPAAAGCKRLLGGTAAQFHAEGPRRRSLTSSRPQYYSTSRPWNESAHVGPCANRSPPFGCRTLESSLHDLGPQVVLNHAIAAGEKACRCVTVRRDDFGVRTRKPFEKEGAGGEAQLISLQLKGDIEWQTRLFTYLHLNIDEGMRHIAVHLHREARERRTELFEQADDRRTIYWVIQHRLFTVD